MPPTESGRFDVSGPQTVQRHDELGSTAGLRGGSVSWASLHLLIIRKADGVFDLPCSAQGKLTSQGKLLQQETFFVSEQDTGVLSRSKERRVFLFEQIVIFSELLRKGSSTPGYQFKKSIKVLVGEGDEGGACQVQFKGSGLRPCGSAPSGFLPGSGGQCGQRSLQVRAVVSGLVGAFHPAGRQRRHQAGVGPTHPGAAGRSEQLPVRWEKV